MEFKRNTNPYRTVKWENIRHISGCTHMHCTNDRVLQKYLADGLGFVTFSNYYPSAPYYPLASIRENCFRCSQKEYVYQDQWHSETLDFNRIIPQWKNELPENCREQLPFQAGNRVFSDLPPGIAEAPNAEHHFFADAHHMLHICSPGAMLTSGTFDRQKEFLLNEHGYLSGCPLPWRQAFSSLLDSMITPDGGGIVINHPNWSHLMPEFICEMLDFDERVLGIEVYNHDSHGLLEGFSENIWDAILSTGRQCYGFFSQDHPTPDQRWCGRIVLLVESPTMENCLRAMRQGQFYGAITGNGLHFEYFDFDGKTLRAGTNRPALFKLLCRTGVADDSTYGTDFVWQLPEDQREKMVFLRLTVIEGRGEEKLFAQPVML